MTTTTLTLSEFLLARIAEDKEAARRATPGPWEVVADDKGGFSGDAGVLTSAPRIDNIVVEHDQAGRADSQHIARHDPARVLAECEAKRRIVELGWHHLGDDDYAWGMEEAKRQILAVLALPYADHPDYRDEWRP